MSEENTENTENVTFHIRTTFFIFILIWLSVILLNKFYLSNAFIVLLIPFFIFGLGLINSEIISDEKLEDDVFTTSFITLGLVISLPLLTLFNNNNREMKNEKKADVKTLNHIIFLAMIFTLLSYYHIWVNKVDRHVCKIIRSCFETMSITLYIFSLTIFFILS
jgi:hypothetical protein